MATLNSIVPISPEIVAYLKDAYNRARREAIAAAPNNPVTWDVEIQRTCPYCGRWWQKWAGSSLDGHAACVVPEWFKELLRTALADPHLRFIDVAEVIGVSPSVIRSWTFPRKNQ